MKSVFLDTNYLLRFLIRDNEEQFSIVYNLILSGSKGQVNLYTSTVVFFEIYWVCSSFYKYDKAECLRLLQKILNLYFIRFENYEVLMRAVEIFKSNSISLEDCYNISLAENFKIEIFGTFDKKALKVFKK